MKNNTGLIIYGEALFDCFPDGQQVLGGAPFNVAWHLQALNNQPLFISRVGNDALGRKIISALSDWGINTHTIQIDPKHLTGQVAVKLVENEPIYTITANCAYDFISTTELDSLPDKGILYHGTLGLRNRVSRNCLAHISQKSELSVFLDVNLRSPWWEKLEVLNWMRRARWVKLNEDEFEQLGFGSADNEQNIYQVKKQFQLEQFIVTQAAQGAKILAADNKIYQQTPSKIESFVDTVGAGDGFSALFIHALLAGWPTNETLNIAQTFASKVIGLQGAIPTNSDFYKEFISL